MSRRLSLSSIVAVLLFAVRASAQPFVVSIRYQPLAQCPAEGWFLQQVLRRARHARLATGAESAREFRVVITNSAKQIRASLEFIDVDSRHVRRVLEGSNCVEVVSGIVLITALAIDPLLANPMQDSAPSQASARQESRRPLEDANRRRTASRPVADRTSANPAIGLDGTLRRWSSMLGVSAGAVSAIAPVWAPSTALYSEFAAPNRNAALRLGVSYSDSGEVKRDGANTRFRLAFGSAGGCAWAVQLTNGLRIWPCAALQSGVFRAEGRQSPRLPFPNSSNSFWLAGDVALRAQIDVNRTLVFEIEGQALVPILRHSYVYERPLTLEYRTPAVGAAAYVGIGVRLDR